MKMKNHFLLSISFLLTFSTFAQLEELTTSEIAYRDSISALNLKNEATAQSQEFYNKGIQYFGEKNYTGAIGESIKVRAVDSVKVESLFLRIFAADDSLLEEGEATQLPNGLDWEYLTTQINPVLTGSRIQFSAKDIPGNTTLLEVVT